MATDYVTAQDEMFGKAQAILDAAASILGYAPDVRFPGVPLTASPDMSKLWARVSEQVVTDGQSTLANAGGKSLFTADGILYVQLFCPRDEPKSVENGKAIALSLQLGFRSGQSVGNVWYRNQKIVEMPETADNYPINFSVEFQYDTLTPA